MQKINVVILGSTGSIGQQALEVINEHSEVFRVVGLAAKDEVPVLLRQIALYHPAAVSVADDAAYRTLIGEVGNEVEVMFGVEGMCELAAMPEADVILIAVSGAVGVLPTLAAIENGKQVALANKETLVAAGDIVMKRVKEKGVLLIPVDSEHSAVFQCLNGEEEHLHKIWLTASGGPFREYSMEELEKVTVEMALKHPNWAMGPKITVDSATLMNKGLEVIEAHHLFNVGYDRIEVLVQKESVIHSMVELVDGSFLAHLGIPDMRIPIQYALAYPRRLESSVQSLDFPSLGTLHFCGPDKEKFPALDLAYHAGRAGGTMPAVLNAANEVAVSSFLDRKINFISIPKVVEKVMLKHENMRNPSLEDILGADAWAREMAEYFVRTMSGM
ncbi:MAG: 1-deoxy-D-xylulose-5-phosphate reductoisomerase [Syntrophomonadaceae bacterium]|nr:1-deoxy-D-xylulose-5-phosphate reductoisomerase [Syntrophomonadaceae bacterium]